MSFWNGRGYFWYSSQQREVVSKMYSPRHPNFCRIGSKVLEYTEWTDSPVNTSKWNDMVFLGKGVYVDHYLQSKPKARRVTV